MYQGDIQGKSIPGGGSSKVIDISMPGHLGKSGEARVMIVNEGKNKK